MNERIKALADKAQEYAEWETPQGLEWLDNFKEQFAKLIIEECVDYAFANGDNVDYLKQYFGVEE
jgi:hypothetical protein